MKLGLGQLLVEGGEPKRNLARARAMIAEAAGLDCDLLVLPEAFDLGWTHPSAKTEAQPIPGPFTGELCDQARRHGMYLCAGLTEKDGNRVYNSAVLISSSGDIILTYRKINVLDVGQEFYEIGRQLGVVETPFGSIGLNICADNYADAYEIGHVLARMGAQLILSPSSWTVDYSQSNQCDPYGDKWVGPLHRIAKLFDLIIVSVTSVGYIVGGPYEGKKMVGCSLVVGSSGILLQSSINEVAGELRVADIELPDRQVRGTSIGNMLKGKGFFQ
jgi:predicted amidohydrolase